METVLPQQQHLGQCWAGRALTRELHSGPHSTKLSSLQKACRNIGHMSVLTGIGRVGSRAIEEGRGATQIGHGGCAISIHACGDRVIVGLLGGGARHVPVW